ncbi:MAG: esterase-like activity of phytase family protein [Pseudomonadota bacterium]
MRHLSILFLSVLAACTAAEIQSGEPRAANESPAQLWAFADHAARLRSESCPEGVAFERAKSLDLQVSEVGLGTALARDRYLSGLSLAGAWHLQSSNADFGGLSGLDVMRSGSLLAVADDGKFVWIGIDPETGAPDGFGSIAEMRDRDGQVYGVKTLADSEGLAYRDGLAFVSYEQNHRIEAYDLEGCGAAARAASVATLHQIVDGSVLENNRGAEAMAMLGDGLSIGFETRNSSGSPVGRVMTDGGLTEVHRTRQPSFYLLTGMDFADGLTIQIFRAYDPVRGPRGLVKVLKNDAEVATAELKDPLPVDNFEGIALGSSPAGTPRIWLISDDNFSNRQRTLLLALDLDPAT